jgi:hypothetical protein
MLAWFAIKHHMTRIITHMISSDLVINYPYTTPCILFGALRIKIFVYGLLTCLRTYFQSFYQSSFEYVLKRLRLHLSFALFPWLKL